MPLTRRWLELSREMVLRYCVLFRVKLISAVSTPTILFGLFLCYFLYALTKKQSNPDVQPKIYSLVSANNQISADFVDDRKNVIELLLDKVRRKIEERLSRASAAHRQMEQDTMFDSFVANFNQPGITFEPLRAGLGNFLFMQAAMFGVARKNQMVPIYTDSGRDRRVDYFEGLHPTYVPKVAIGPSAILREKSWGKFMPAIFNLKRKFTKKNQTVVMSGYWQSWKYFHHIQNEIRSVFTFTGYIYNQTIREIEQGLGAVNQIEPTILPILVGVHVRRGDILKDPHRSNGQVPASASYLLGTVQLVREKYGTVVIFVLSNDLRYCKNIFRDGDFVFLSGTSEATDLALLSLMDVVVVSVGSFGWWGAFLSEAKEVYYFKNWPRKGSYLDENFSPQDYFPPDWIGRE